jgi:DNA-binding MarR family transcriptional regulator
MTAAGFSDVRPAHQKVLDGIGDGTRLSGLAENAGVSKQAMAGLVEHLQKGGYVERSSDSKDRRAVILKLTPAGMAARDAARTILDDLLGEVRQAVGKNRMRELRTTLSEVDSVLATTISSAPSLVEPNLSLPPGPTTRLA